MYCNCNLSPRYSTTTTTTNNNNQQLHITAPFYKTPHCTTPQPHQSANVDGCAQVQYTIALLIQSQLPQTPVNGCGVAGICYLIWYLDTGEACCSAEWLWLVHVMYWIDAVHGIWYGVHAQQQQQQQQQQSRHYHYHDGSMEPCGLLASKISLPYYCYVVIMIIIVVIRKNYHSCSSPVQTRPVQSRLEQSCTPPSPSIDPPLLV